MYSASILARMATNFLGWGHVRWPACGIRSHQHVPIVPITVGVRVLFQVGVIVSPMVMSMNLIAVIGAIAVPTI